MPRVLYVQFTDPAGYPPVEHGAHLLADAGCEVRVLGVHVADVAALRFRPHPRVDLRYRGGYATGVRQRVQYLRYVGWALREALAWRPDWVYASDVLAAPIGLALSRVGRTRIVYHEHDTPPPGARGFMRAAAAARARLARRAHLLIAPNEDRARLLAQAGGGRAVEVVWNCPRRDEVRFRSRRHDGLLRVIYQGSVVAERLPTTVLSALAAVPEVELVVVGYEPGGARAYLRAFEREATRLGVAARVQVVGPAARPRMLDLCATCDVGLALMPMESADVNMRWMTGASNKAFEYLACGLPMLVTDLPGWRDMFVAPGFALPCDPGDARSIADALRWCVAHRDEVAARGQAGQQRIVSEWNYETQFAAVRASLLGWPTVPGRPAGDAVPAALAREAHA